MAATKKRGTETLGDMVRSLGLVGIVVAALFLLARPPGSDEQQIRTVSWTDDVAVARMAADYPVSAPTGLPDGWRATSASTDLPVQAGGGPVGLHIGFVTPDDGYAAVEVSDVDGDDFTERVTEKAPRTGQVQIDGASWAVYTRDDTTTYRHQVGRSTVLVTGTADAHELQELAQALSTS